MSRYPAAAWKPAGTPGGPITPRIVIYHSAVVPGWGTPVPHDGLEWHFFIHRDGTVDQLVDTNRRADANYHANDFAISVESADDGHPDLTPWTPEQLDAMEGIARWAHTEHGIPLVQTPTWDGHGLGYHTLFGAPGPWTPYNKTCPGIARKLQWAGFLARFAVAPNPPIPHPQPEVDMILYHVVGVPPGAVPGFTGDNYAALHTGASIVGIESSDTIAKHVTAGVPYIEIPWRQMQRMVAALEMAPKGELEHGQV